MSYFVTGATGFIGRHLVEELLRNREGDIYVLVRAGSQDRLDKLIAERWGSSDRIKPVAGDQELVGLRLDLRPHPLRLLRLARVDAGIGLTDQIRNVRTERGAQLVHRPRVVDMAVGQHDPPDRHVAGGRDDVLPTALQRGVDEREAVVLTDQIGVDEPQSRELDQGRCDGRGAHDLRG